VCALINRGVAPKYIEAGGVAVLNQKCVRDHRITFDFGRRHDAAAKKVDPERFIRVGDVLVNSTGTGTLGRVAQVRSEPPEPTTVDTHVTIVRPEAGRFYPDFFGYMLIQIEDEIARSGEGASGQTELARSTLQNKFSVSFPTSLPEQQRIVAILDEVFAGLATATANAKKNLENAKELFEGYVDSVFLRQEDWDRTTLGAIAEFKNGLNFKKSSKGDKIQIVGVKDFQSHFWVPNDELESAQIDGGLSDAYLLRKNDILTVRSNGNKQLIGRTVLAGEVAGKVSHSGFTIRIRIVEPGVDPVYLVRYLKPGAVRRALIESGDGAQISNLNQQALTALPVMLPTFRQQQEIAAKLAEIEEASLQLQEQYQQKLSDISELGQSILQKAFTGELTSPPSQVIKEAAE
jgi:type I restriction enzyme S subunit